MFSTATTARTLSGDRRQRGHAWYALLAVSGALAALAAVLYVSLAHRELAGDLPTGGGVNSSGAAAIVRPRPAPLFELPSFTGTAFRLQEHRGSVVVVNFWASWCAPCRAEALALERSWQQNHERAVFVGVNVWDKAPAARRFAELVSSTYPLVQDVSGETAIAYGVQGLPETFIVDPSGQIVRKWMGPLTEGQLSTMLAEVAQ